jgi:hypothetical protein
MPSEFRIWRAIATATLAAGATFLLVGCNNAYRPPTNGKPETWGEQHYLDVERSHEQTENRMELP